MTFAEKLADLLVTRGKNQSRLARETGIGQRTINNLVLAKQRPYMDQALKLARALEVPLDYLADDEIDEPPASTPDLTEGERAVLALFNALELPLHEALRRLAGPSASASDAAGPTRHRLG